MRCPIPSRHVLASAQRRCLLGLRAAGPDSWVGWSPWHSMPRPRHKKPTLLLTAEEESNPDNGGSKQQSERSFGLRGPNMEQHLPTLQA